MSGGSGGGGHNHVPGSGCCEHEHLSAGGGGGAGDTLLPYVDVPRVTCLNERVVGSCRAVWRAHADRASKSPPFLDSTESDPEMLMDVPLTATVRLRSICVSGGEGGRTPSTVRLFVNREHLDFTGAQEGKPAQEISLSHEDPGAETWHPLKPARFTGVGSLQLHFVGALGGPEVGEEEGTRVYYIGLRGDVVGVKGTAPAVIVYEARPQLADHKVEAGKERVGGGSMGV
jgi:hypothetical protein